MLDLGTSWRKLTRHPLSEAFLDMEESCFEAMLADMKQHGYDPKQQVFLFEGKVLDGWHRFRAAVMTNQVPTFDTYKGDDPLGFVIRRNLTRRHLDASQRGLIAGRLATLSKGGDRRSRDFQRVNLPSEKLAKTLGISEKTVDLGKKVTENGDPELQVAVEERVISVSDAAAVADKPKPVQRRAVKAVKSGKAKTVREAVGESKPKKTEVSTQPGMIQCPLCKGGGRIVKQVQNDLFDAVAQVTGSDTRVSGSHIAKVAKLLLTADPPYTAGEVRQFPAAIKKAGWKTPCTVGMIEKYIGWVRHEGQRGSDFFDGINEFLRRHGS